MQVHDRHEARHYPTWSRTGELGGRRVHCEGPDLPHSIPDARDAGMAGEQSIPQGRVPEPPGVSSTDGTDAIWTARSMRARGSGRISSRKRTGRAVAWQRPGMRPVQRRAWSCARRSGRLDGRGCSGPRKRRRSRGGPSPKVEDERKICVMCGEHPGEQLCSQCSYDAIGAR